MAQWISFNDTIGTGTIDNPIGKHWGGLAASATPAERKTTVEGLQYRINAGIDSPRVVGAPVMAYSPRSKTTETFLDKKLHGLINADGTVTELPQYASWQWALKFTQAGINDVDSYFELVSFIGGPAAAAYSDVTQPNNNWPVKTAQSGTREVFATQAIRNLGLTTTTGEEWASESANLISRGGYIQDYQWHGIDPVAVIMPGYITVSNGDTLYTGVTGSNPNDYNLTTQVKVGTGVKARTYPVKRGLTNADAGNAGACGWNQISSTLSQIWTPGYVEFGSENCSSMYNLRSLTYLGASSFISNNWGSHLGNNYSNVLSSVYYNAGNASLKASFNANVSSFKTKNQALIDTPTGTYAPGDAFSPVNPSNSSYTPLKPSSYYPLLHHQK